MPAGGNDFDFARVFIQGTGAVLELKKQFRS